MGKKKVVLFLVLLPVVAVVSGALLARVIHNATAQRNAPDNKQANHGRIVLPLKKESQESVISPHLVTFRVKAGDARPFLLKRFLETHKSPMSPYADTLVKEADKNGFDYRLTTAIAMCESNAGKRMPTKASNNAFGISVYSGQNFGANFHSWEFAIEWVSGYIKRRYYDQGLISLVDIGQRWAPPSVEKGNSWANCVQSFMDKII